MLRTVGFSLLLSSCLGQDFTPLTDIKTLSELSLEKLLQVQHSLRIDTNTNDVMASNEVSTEINLPGALALQRKPIKRGDYEEYGNVNTGGKTNIQSIFQTSVTALAFLAFGGYLVCLVTQAINGKTNNNDQVIVMQSLTRPNRRRRPTRLRRRTTRRPFVRHRRSVLPNTDPESMYNALVMLTEAYTKYHTTWTNNFNHSNYINIF